VSSNCDQSGALASLTGTLARRHRVCTVSASLLGHGLSSGHQCCASRWPLLGIRSLAPTEVKASNVVPIIKQKSACDFFLTLSSL